MEPPGTKTHQAVELEPKQGQNAKSLNLRSYGVMITIPETNSKFAPENKPCAKRKGESLPTNPSFRGLSLLGSGRVMISF